MVQQMARPSAKLVHLQPTPRPGQEVDRETPRSLI